MKAPQKGTKVHKIVPASWKHIFAGISAYVNKPKKGVCHFDDFSPKKATKIKCLRSSTLLGWKWFAWMSFIYDITSLSFQRQMNGIERQMKHIKATLASQKDVQKNEFSIMNKQTKREDAKEQERKKKKIRTKMKMLWMKWTTA